MEDELAFSLDGKTLGSLRVVDLKQELEKRGLSKSGSKKDLVKRLKQQLEFDKLSDERKLTADGDLKIKLDAVTEQNEFVQQYLAQQQKLFAEQNVANPNLENKEIPSSDNEEDDDSPLADESRKSIIEALNKSKQNNENEDSNSNNVNIKENIDNNACESEEKERNIVETSTESVNISTSEEISDSNSLCVPSKIDMEPPVKSSSVPYSLSDIQLPESPGKQLTSKSCVSENSQHSESSAIPPASEIDETMKTNGIKLSDSKSSEMSEIQETASSQQLDSSDPSITSLNKDKKLLNDDDHDQSEESNENNDSEVNDSNNKSEDASESNEPKDVASPNKFSNDSEDKTCSKSDEIEKKMQTSDDSENEKSSDSDKCNKHVKSNETTIDKRKCRTKSYSESNSSRSSESSPERFKKKSLKLKRHDVKENDTQEKTETHAVEEKSAHKEEFKISSTISSKQKLKIKRSNVPLPTNSSKSESSNETPFQNDQKSKVSLVQSPSVDTQNSVKEISEATEEIAKPYVSRKVTLLNRKQSCSSVEEKDDEPKQKKSKWGSFASMQKNSHAINISTNSLKSWFPDFKLINEPVAEIISNEQSPPVIEEKIISTFSNNNIASHKRMAVQKKEVFEQDIKMEVEEYVEPGPATNVIFIQNLVRPFTLLQLKDLLKQNGNIIEEEFWIDKIKSKCIVVYENEESAVKAKTSLNNTRWPPSNPKILTVQYVNEDDIEFHKRGGEPPKSALEPPVEAVDDFEMKAVVPIEEHKKRDKEHRREREKSKLLQHVREWDKDKIIQRSPEHDHIVDQENEKTKIFEKKEKKESKRKANEDTPAKLLDDLFQKTKATPCIYWLPLNEEQRRERAESKHLRRLEREKRMAKEKELEDSERKNRISRLNRRSREMESPRSSTRSRSPVTRRR